MSRSNYDKPFYVDVGTSIVAIRCASNHDVIAQYDHVWHPHTLKLAEDVCDRMNKEVEIGKPLRNCDVGTLTEQQKRFQDFCEKMQHTDKACCGGCPIVYLRMKGVISNSCELAWAQMPYEAQEGGDK